MGRAMKDLVGQLLRRRGVELTLPRNGHAPHVTIRGKVADGPSTMLGRPMVLLINSWNEAQELIDQLERYKLWQQVFNTCARCQDGDKHTHEMGQ